MLLSAVVLKWVSACRGLAMINQTSTCDYNLSKLKMHAFGYFRRLWSVLHVYWSLWMNLKLHSVEATLGLLGSCAFQELIQRVDIFSSCLECVHLDVSIMPPNDSACGRSERAKLWPLLKRPAEKQWEDTVSVFDSASFFLSFHCSRT